MWLNQYTNADDWIAHRPGPTPAIAGQLPDIDVLFVGAGTRAR